ncbi:MAG: SDR family oxidoreductase [Pseudomonadota bacterium]
MKTALITGSAAGIGARVAQDLDNQGYRLWLVDINESANRRLAKEFQNARCISLDLSDKEALRSFCNEVELAQLDLAFINAGVAIPGDVMDVSEEVIDLHLDVNLRSAILLNQACAKTMAKRGRGHIITTVSMGGITPLKGTAVYSATKFALRGFLSALHSEVKSKGVAVSGIYPSAVDTEMLRNEVRNDGSPLNFVSSVASVGDVARVVQRAMRSKKLEEYVSRTDGLTSRLVGFFPSLLDRLYPTLERIGQKGMQRYKESM